MQLSIYSKSVFSVLKSRVMPISESVWNRKEINRQNRLTHCLHSLIQYKTFGKKSFLFQTSPFISMSMLYWNWNTTAGQRTVFPKYLKWVKECKHCVSQFGLLEASQQSRHTTLKWTCFLEAFHLFPAVEMKNFTAKNIHEVSSVLHL